MSNQNYTNVVKAGLLCPCVVKSHLTFPMYFVSNLVTDNILFFWDFFSMIMNWLAAACGVVAISEEKLFLIPPVGEQESPIILMQRGSNQTEK